MDFKKLRRGEKASNLPETVFKTLILFVVLYTSFLFYTQDRFIVALGILVFMFVMAWGLFGSEFF